MSAIAIIPARGGSKRIPRKNIKDFFGKPIIAYAIETALKSGLFETVMVSTDDEEIAAIARRYGADVPFMRSAATASDFATTAEVLNEVLDRYEEKGVTFDLLCCIYPCTPLLQAATLAKAFKELRDRQMDTVFPVLPFGFPVQRALAFEESGALRFLQPEFALSRSQDLAKTYHDAGQFYWLDRQRFRQTGKILTENTGGIIITEMEAQDVDNETDWKLAELKFQLK